MAIGQLLELGLNEFSGRSCNNVWRDILAGERGVPTPTPSDNGVSRQDGIPRDSISARIMDLSAAACFLSIFRSVTRVAKGATVRRPHPRGDQTGNKGMRCYFLRSGHIVAAEELTSVSDKEAI